VKAVPSNLIYSPYYTLLSYEASVQYYIDEYRFALAIKEKRSCFWVVRSTI